MSVEGYVPAEVLQPYIKSFLIIETENGLANKLLPDTSIVMAFRYRGIITDELHGIERPMPGAQLSGIRKSMRLVKYAVGASALLVLFKPGGASAFFREPLHELFGSGLPLDILINPGKLNTVYEQLAEAKNNPQRIAIIEKLLLGRLNGGRQDRIVDHAIQQIISTNGAIKINEMVKTLPLSSDPLEKRFRRLTGASPKQFSSIVRLRNVIYTYTSSQNLTGTALTAGYFDQAHFIKDFKLFTGQAPREFFKSAPLFW